LLIAGIICCIALPSTYTAKIDGHVIIKIRLYNTKSTNSEAARRKLSSLVYLLHFTYLTPDGHFYHVLKLFPTFLKRFDVLIFHQRFFVYDLDDKPVSTDGGDDDADDVMA